MKLLYFFMGLVLILNSSTSSAETQYIRSVQCKLMQSPNFKAEVVEVLKQGEVVAVLESQGVWVKVETEQKQQGWLSKFLLSVSPPDMSQREVLQFKDEDLKNVRQRASVITTAAAARGLTAREVDSGLDKPILEGQNFEALKLMESYRPTDAQIQDFIQSIPYSQ